MVKPSDNYNLKALSPALAGQWHPLKNGTLTADNVTPGSNRKVWWLCHKGHEWRASVYNRNNGSGCPYCAGKKASKENSLMVFNAGLSNQWHPTKNGKLTPDNVTPYSHLRVWWQCDKGHEWQTAVASRSSRGSGCPYCAVRKTGKHSNLSALHPELASQWHPTKNGELTPANVTPSSSKKVWWFCKKGHEWQAVIANRSIGSGCPYCAGKKASKEYNLSVIRPELASQWHPTKNRDVTPDKVAPSSAKKVWWICDKGHEWQAVIGNRSNGTGCPYCAGKKATREHNLSTIQPGTASQWHPAKNGTLTPDKVTPVSHKKVWWVCDKGHEWQASVASRHSGSGCPYCAGKKASKEYNLRTIRPELADQWHPTKNHELTPGKVTPGSGLKAWWVCDKGHEWQAIIASRSNGSGCPYCTFRKFNSDNNLSALQPELAAQWHPTKNRELTPGEVTSSSAKKVWWMCDKGHEWQAIIANRHSGSGCPYCAGKKASKEYNLSVIRPELADQWHPTKNRKLSPDNVTPGSESKVWWVCNKGHEWQAIIASRNSGSGCPYCSGRKASKESSLSTCRPELAAQWHPGKNGELTPGKVTPGSNLIVWWVCDKDHEWRARIANRSSGSGCPYCTGRKVSKENNLSVHHPELAAQWHPGKNGTLTPDKVTSGTHLKVWWLCKNGHEWRASIGSRSKSNGTGCPYCAGKRKNRL
jgi:hypothetical protein